VTSLRDVLLLTLALARFVLCWIPKLELLLWITFFSKSPWRDTGTSKPAKVDMFSNSSTASVLLAPSSRATMALLVKTRTLLPIESSLDLDRVLAGNRSPSLRVRGRPQARLSRLWGNPKARGTGLCSLNSCSPRPGRVECHGSGNR